MTTSEAVGVVTTTVPEAPELDDAMIAGELQTELRGGGGGGGTHVRELMTPDVVTCPEDATAQEVARLMREHEVGSVLVTRGTDLVGIVTDRDLVVRALADGLADAAAGEVCTRNPATLRPDQSYAEAADLMSAYAVRRLPVLEDGTVVGVLSLGDLALGDATVEEEVDLTLTGSLSGDVLADVSAAEPPGGTEEVTKGS